MKTLYLVRHSKAAQRRPQLPDFERTLVRSGEKDALGMAKKLKKEGFIPDLLMSSTANRALETAHIFAKGLKYPVEKILVKDALYSEMSEEALLYIIRQVDNRYNSLMLFGHNPVFTDLACLLIADFHEDIPKSGVVGIEFAKTEWKAISPRTGRLMLFEYPKRMSKTYKQLQSDLETAIRDRILNILARVDPGSAKKEAKLVRQTSKKIADDFIKTLKQTQTKEEKRALSNQRKLLSSLEPPAEDTAPAPKKTIPKKPAQEVALPMPKTASQPRRAARSSSSAVSRTKPTASRAKAKNKAAPAKKPTSPRTRPAGKSATST
jgi:phosphohistidine phosphatase